MRRGNDRSVIFGVLFKKIYGLFKKYTLAISVFLSALAYFILSSSNGKVSSVLAMFIYGIAVSIIFPFLVISATDIAGNARKSQTFIISIVTSSTYLGQFCSVFYISIIAGIANTELSRALFNITAYVLAALCIVLIVISFFYKKEISNSTGTIPETEFKNV
ncbi:MAG: hypothetical protein JW864_04095 [Spirochaetes bacterium]|nr:hypothetical protein [Spirochaetota bacterium]